MAKRKTRAKSAASLGLPKDWTLPALADRRTKARPSRETPSQRARAARKRRGD
jgi:hypothetical protein